MNFISATRLYLSLLLLCFFTSTLYSIDNAHFFKAASFHGDSSTSRWDGKKPYEGKEWMSKVDNRYAWGDANSGWNNSGDKTSVLNIYGPQNMLHLFTNVEKRPSELQFAELLGNALNQTMTNDSFGQLKFTGEFEITEANVDWRQNLNAGFFIEVHLPVRDVEIEDICFEDLSPCTGKFSQDTPEWKRLLNNLDVILNNHGYETLASKYDKTDVGDLSILAGWEHIDRESFDMLYSLRALVKAGALAPTGAKDDPRFVFSVPTGYNDHWGIPVHVEVEAAFRKWLDISGRAGATFFFDKTLIRRMKTHEKQNGFIKLEQGKAKVEKGTLWYLGADVRFDHFYQGFSFLFGYSFNRSEKDRLTPKEKCCKVECNRATLIDKFNADIVNSDSVLQRWYRHTLHFILDYDFSIHGFLRNEKYGPRLTIYYDLPVYGKNVFDTEMLGGGIGLDIRWEF